MSKIVRTRNRPVGMDRKKLQTSLNVRQLYNIVNTELPFTALFRCCFFLTFYEENRSSSFARHYFIDEGIRTNIETTVIFLHRLYASLPLTKLF